MNFDSHLLEPSYHGNSCHGNKRQMKGSNLAFEAAENEETAIATVVKIQLQTEDTDTLCLDWDQ